MARLKILIADSLLPLRSTSKYLVCVALPSRRRSCWWEAVMQFKTIRAAKVNYKNMDQKFDDLHTGRALIFLSNPDLILYDHDGCEVHIPAQEPGDTNANQT